MKCTFHWLQEFVDFEFSPAELGEKLTMLGLEVDSMESIQRRVETALVGEVVVKIDDHHYQVDIGKNRITIESHFFPLREGDKIAVELQGETPVLASYKMLAISEDESPVLVDTNTPTGSNLSSIIPSRDTVYDIDLTPNRPDCLSIIGIAREIAALTGNPLRMPSIQVFESKVPARDYVKVSIQTPEGCPRYAARVIRGVTVRPSPIWMHDRLVKVGLRAINNVVDVTNYVMIETGHPLHAFDLDCLQGGEIRVRLSQHGEHFVTLDGKGHTLDDETVLICDGERPVALGGVMGGRNSEVSETTHDLLLECAYFTPAFIRKTAGRLGISTDASIRFSRGTDPNGVETAINRTSRLLAQLCGGQILQGIVDEYRTRIPRPKVRLRSSRVQAVLGTSVHSERIHTILKNLGCEVHSDPRTKPDQFDVLIPTFRPDLTREIDLIEEISRVIGYDQIPEKLDSCLQLSHIVNTKERYLKQIRDFWVGLGLNETVSNSMIPLSDGSLEFYPQKTIQLKNPLSEDMAVLRPSLIPSLIRLAQYNLFRQQEILRMFEIGNTFLPQGNSHREELLLGAIFYGSARPISWISREKPFDFFDLKGYLSGFFQRFHIENVAFTPSRHWAFENGSAKMESKGQPLGVAGAVKKVILDKYDIPRQCFIFELNLENIFSNIKSDRYFKPVPRFPSVQRDLAFVLDLDIPGGRLLEEITKWGGTYLKDLKVFDVYTGNQVPSGKKSIAVSLIFQAEERTLTESEINETVDRIILELKHSLQAELRR